MSNSRSLAKLPAFLSPAGVLSPQAGGTGVNSLNAAVGALGLTIGTDVQAYDADLGSIAGLTGTAGLLKKTATNTWTLDTSAYLTGITSGQVTTALGFTPYNATNPSGYISGITSSNVTTALGFTPYNATNPSGYISGITSSNVTTALGYTPENSAVKGSANGYASLDGSGLVPASQLPSYVDDVLEYANLAGFPATGTTGKIFVALDTNKTYRWSGSAYVYITSGAVDSVAGKTGVVSLASSDVGLGNVENKSSAAIRSEISSANVTGALGFTPYNATNPSGYITTSALSGYLTSATAASTYQPIGSYLTGITSSQVTTALGFTPYNSSNPSGYITGITSANVTTALGFTPYNSSNPSGYITSSALSSYAPLTGSGASGTWGISISGNAATANSTDAINGVSFRNTGSNSGTNADTISTNGITYYIAGVPNFSGNATDGALYSQAYSVNWQHQIAGDYRSGQIALRGKNFGTWQSWRTVLDSSNYTSYAMPAGASATNSVDIRAPIFYDQNDTGYYVNPNGTSNLNTLSLSGMNTFTLNGKIDLPSGSGGATFSANHYSFGGKDIANGSWSHPHYSDLIIGYHTGIRIGGSYSGIRFYNNSPTTDANNDGNGDQGENLLMTVGGYVGTANGTDVFVNNNLFAGASMRSPIYYDSDNTSYYINPASTSRVSSIDFGTSGYYINAGDWGMRNTTPYGWIQFGPANSSWAHIYASQSIYFNVNTYVNGNWMLYEDTWQNNKYFGSDGIIRSGVDMRAPLYYDSADTSYYVDPNGGSRLTHIFAGNVGSSNDGGWNARFNLVGSAHARMDVVSNSDGIITTMYSHTGQGVGRVGTYSNHPLTLMAQGGAEGGRVYSGSIRAPIFYDLDNTDYYLDPAGTSYLNVLSGPALNDTQLWLRTKGDTNHYLWNAADDWEEMVMYFGTGFRVTNSNGNGTLLYCYGTTNGNHVYTPTSFRAPIFYDSDNTSYYVDPGNYTSLYGGLQVLGAHNTTRSFLQLPAGNNGAATGVVALTSWCSEPGISWDYAGFGYNVINDGGSPGGFSRFNTSFGQAYMRFSPAGETLFYNVTPSGTRYTTMLFNNIGEVTTYQGLYVPIMYDSNNAAYYVDPASTTVMNAVNVTSLNINGVAVTAGGGGGGDAFSAF